MKNFTQIFLCFLWVSPVLSNAQPMTPDSLFGNNSVGVYPVTSNPTLVEIISLPNNYILLGGYNFNSGPNAFYINMTKADYCGGVDTSFGTGGHVIHTYSQRNIAYDFALQIDEKILSCGIQSTGSSGSAQIPYVGRFLSNGQADTTFGTGGSTSLRFDNISSGRFNAVNLLADGRIVCTGYSTANINGGTNGIGTMRFMPDGSLDLTFNGTGISRYNITISNNKGAGFIVSDDKIIATGATLNSGSTWFLATRWDSTGVLDPAFGTGGVFVDSVLAINSAVVAVIQPDEYLVMAAPASSPATDIHLVRLNTNGEPDLLFGINGRITISHPSITELHGMQLMADGKFLLIGRSNTGGSNAFCLRLNQDGTLDSSFATNGFFEVGQGANAFQYAKAMMELPNGQWLFAGSQATGFTLRRFDFNSNVPHISQVFNYLQATGNGTYQWMLNGMPIAGAVNDTLNLTQNGIYNVLLTGDYGCSYLSDPYTVSNVDIQDIDDKSLFVYPNPLDRFLSVRKKSEHTGMMKLFSIDGKLIELFPLETGKVSQEFNVDHIESGTYFLIIQGNLTSSMHRIIKI